LSIELFEAWQVNITNVRML